MTRSHLLFLLIALPLLVALLLLFAGHLATRAPTRAAVAQDATGDPGLWLRDAEGRRLAATALPGRPGGGAVLLLHGRGGSRQSMLGRARLLQDEGVAVLMLDHSGHGDSEGGRHGFGYRERLGVQAAWSWMQTQWPTERLGVVAVSLGGAALLQADLSPRPAAVVLEMVYPTIEEAAGNRLRMRVGALGELLLPVFMWQLPLWTGNDAEAQRPIEQIASLGSPLLLLAGSDDRHTTLAESRRLFDAAREPKQLWVVQGAAHEDLEAHDPAGYRSRVLGFLLPKLQRITGALA
jgi:alpha-beta hydrolase superfamily lysophospholipase